MEKVFVLPEIDHMEWLMDQVIAHVYPQHKETDPRAFLKAVQGHIGGVSMAYRGKGYQGYRYGMKGMLAGETKVTILSEPLKRKYPPFRFVFDAPTEAACREFEDLVWGCNMGYLLSKAEVTTDFYSGKAQQVVKVIVGTACLSYMRNRWSHQNTSYLNQPWQSTRGFRIYFKQDERGERARFEQALNRGKLKELGINRFEQLIMLPAATLMKGISFATIDWAQVREMSQRMNKRFSRGTTSHPGVSDGEIDAAEQLYNNKGISYTTSVLKQKQGFCRLTQKTCNRCSHLVRGRCKDLESNPDGFWDCDLWRAVRRSHELNGLFKEMTEGQTVGSLLGWSSEPVDPKDTEAIDSQHAPNGPASQPLSAPQEPGDCAGVEPDTGTEGIILRRELVPPVAMSGAYGYLVTLEPSETSVQESVIPDTEEVRDIQLFSGRWGSGQDEVMSALAEVPWTVVPVHTEVTGASGRAMVGVVAPAGLMDKSGVSGVPALPAGRNEYLPDQYHSSVQGDPSVTPVRPIGKPVSRASPEPTAVITVRSGSRDWIPPP